MGKPSPGLLKIEHLPSTVFFHSWPLAHPPGYSLVSLPALAHLEAQQSYARCWPTELNPSQLEIWQRKDRIVLFLYTKYRFLSLLPSFARFVITYLPFSGYPGSVKGERGQQECPQSTFQAGGQENGAVVPNTEWYSEQFSLSIADYVPRRNISSTCYNCCIFLEKLESTGCVSSKKKKKICRGQCGWLSAEHFFHLSPCNSGEFARVHTERGGLTSQRINTRKQIVLYKCADKWCNYNQEWARFLFSVCGLQLLCMALILPMLQQEHSSEWRNGNTCTAQDISCRE